MDLELLGSLGWREGLIAIIAVLLSYIGVMFVRMRRLQNDLRVAAVPPSVAQSALAAYSSVENPESSAVNVSSDAGAADPLVAAAESPSPVEADEPDFAWNEPPPEIPGQAMIEALQAEVHQLRGDVGELRVELSDLRGELLAARDDFRLQMAPFSGSGPGSAPAPSPLYNDAMQMAVQGLDASTIAQRCGIARAEADLVVSLVRNRNDGVR